MIQPIKRDCPACGAHIPEPFVGHACPKAEPPRERTALDLIETCIDVAESDGGGGCLSPADLSRAREELKRLSPDAFEAGVRTAIAAIEGIPSVPWMTADGKTREERAAEAALAKNPYRSRT